LWYSLVKFDELGCGGGGFGIRVATALVVSAVYVVAVRAQAVARLMRSAAIRARNLVHAGRTPAASGFLARVILGDVVFGADRATGVGGFAPFRNVAVLLAAGALGVVSELEVLFDLAVPAADGNAVAEA
jgi:hypothetical protein